MNVAQRIEPQNAATPFTVERVTGSLGADVAGLDLTQKLSDATIDAISAALVEHKVLFFRDQAISRQQHLAFGRRFGPLEIHPFFDYGQHNAEPEFVVIESTAEKPVAADVWHSDVTFRAEPSLGSILRCRIAPAAGGDTLFADMAAAYEGLDDATRSRISGMTAIHDWHVFRQDGKYDQTNGNDRLVRLREQFPPVEHPVVRTHPVSGKKILYVNTNFTAGIKGMKDSESGPLLERLYRQAHIPDYQCRFRWRADSIAFWDNRSTQHYATKDFYPQHRLVERVTIVGDRPF